MRKSFGNDEGGGGVAGELPENVEDDEGRERRARAATRAEVVWFCQNRVLIRL